MCAFWHGAPSPHTFAPNMPATVFLDPQADMFEMRNAKKTAPLAWPPKRAYLCTEYASKGVFGYLGWGCLKCTVPQNVGFWHGAPRAHTSGLNMPAKVFLIPKMGLFAMRTAKVCGFGMAPQARIPLHQIFQQRCCWRPRMGVFGMRNATNVGVWRGAPSAHTSAPNMPATVFWDT